MLLYEFKTGEMVEAAFVTKTGQQNRFPGFTPPTIIPTTDPRPRGMAPAGPNDGCTKSSTAGLRQRGADFFTLVHPYEHERFDVFRDAHRATLKMAAYVRHPIILRIAEIDNATVDQSYTNVGTLEALGLVTEEGKNKMIDNLFAAVARLSCLCQEKVSIMFALPDTPATSCDAVFGAMRAQMR